MVVDSEVMLEPHHGRGPSAHCGSAAGDDDALAAAGADAALRGRSVQKVAEAEREESHGTRAAAATAAAIGVAGRG